MDSKHKILLNLKRKFNKTKDKELLYQMEEILNQFPFYQNIFIETQRLFVFRQLGKIKEGLKRGKECLKRFEKENLLNSNSTKWFFNEYCWLIYFYLKETELDLSNLEEAFKKVYDFSKKTNEGNLVLPLTFLHIFKVYKKKNKLNLAGFLFNKELNKLYLSVEERELKLKLLKVISDYYKFKKDWKSVKYWIETQTLKHLNIFLMRDLAIAYGKLGEIDKALNLFFENILLQKRDWYIFADIGRLYLKKKDYQNAEKYLLISLILNKNENYTVSVIEDYGRLLEELGSIIQAACYFKLSASLRAKNNWNVNDNILQKALKCKDELQNFNSLKKQWLGLLKEKGFVKEGTISKIFAGGKSGFLLSKEKSIFFLNPSNLPLTLDKTYSYFLVPSFDKKKNRKTNAALLLFS